MNIELWKTVFFSKYSYKFCQTKINKFLSTSSKIYSKKTFRMKNKFTFRQDLKKASVENSKSKIYSSELFSEESECDKENDSLNFRQTFVSADLLSKDVNRSQRKIVLPKKTKIKKPSLSYQGEILFGVHPVHLALLQKKRTFYHLYARENIEPSNEDVSKKTEIIKLARILNIPISFIDSRGLKILAPSEVHQGICLDAGFLPLPLWNEDQCDKETSENRPLWLVLDEILDPMNVGAIIRSAYYFGVNRVFTVIGNSCKLSPTVSKASSGILEVMDMYQIGNLEEFVMRRRDSGWSVVSTLSYSNNQSDIVKPISADEFNTSKPTVLILGNEGRGISENILKLCDTLISIQPGQELLKGIDSLNVSVAAGVILYVLSNSRNKR